VTGVDGGGTVALTNDNQNILAADQNATNSETLGGTGAITNFAGATASDALTPAEAAQDATDVLDQFGYGALTTAALDMDVTTLNAALTTGAILAEQLSEVLDICAGRNYVVPSGSTVETGGEFQPSTGDFDDSEIPFRRIYDGGSLRIDFNEGRLSIASSDSFTYGGDEGAAVAVYNNDGTLYTGL